jgi:6-methylsalicylate decarboxylase
MSDLGLITDVHQHLWPPALIDGLRRRTAPPRLRGWRLELAGEPDYDVVPADHDVGRRAQQARDDGLGAAIVSLSSALGIEELAPGEAAPLLDAYHDGALELPAPFRAWAAAGLSELDPDALGRRLDRGFVGLQLPATTLLDERGYDRVAPLLGVLETRERALFVHPGPATPSRGGVVPGWWPAIVDYVQQMHAAWYGFRVFGRPRHPRLRVCFAMLAGLAPLHSERFAARAGERSVVDEHCFFEISSYGTRAVDAVVRTLGIDVLVNGSDRPYAEPVVVDLGEAVMHALRNSNPDRLLQPEEVSDDLALSARAQP